LSPRRSRCDSDRRDGGTMGHVTHRASVHYYGRRRILILDSNVWRRQPESRSGAPRHDRNDRPRGQMRWLTGRGAPQLSLTTPLTRPPRDGIRGVTRRNRRRDGSTITGQTVLGRVDHSVRRRIRKPRSQGAVRSPSVVMAGPLKNGPKVALGQWNHGVQALSTHCVDQAFAEGVRLERKLAS